MHLVTFTWQDGVSAEQVEALNGELGALPALIPELRAYHYGPDLGLRSGNGDYGVCAAADTEAGILAYLDHPEHLRIVRDVITPMRDQRLAVQIRVPD